MVKCVAKIGLAGPSQSRVVALWATLDVARFQPWQRAKFAGSTAFFHSVVKDVSLTWWSLLPTSRIVAINGSAKRQDTATAEDAAY